jgi:hypothetical protein
MPAARLWSVECWHVGGANFLVVLSKSLGPKYGVVVSRIHGKLCTRPMRANGSYRGVPLAGVTPAPMALRAVHEQARREAAREVEGLRFA